MGQQRHEFRGFFQVFNAEYDLYSHEFRGREPRGGLEVTVTKFDKIIVIFAQCFKLDSIEQSLLLSKE